MRKKHHRTEGQRGGLESSLELGGPETVLVTISVAPEVSYLLPKIPLREQIQLPTGSTCWHLRETLDLPAAEILLLVNQEVKSDDVVLEAGDHIEIVPLLDGG